MAMEPRKIRRALLSVSDKTGILGLARFLAGTGVEIISTGGTAKALEDSGIPYTPIEKVTGNPEAFGGRMKTISFPVASALLYRRGNSSDEAEAVQLGVEAIDFVACNLYPFAETARAGGTDDELIEKIDVGGPTMIRAAAKNFSAVTIAVDPSDYPRIIEELDQHSGCISYELRQEMALKAFSLTAEYDVMISKELSKRFAKDGGRLEWMKLSHGRELRYGENPHQKAQYFRSDDLRGSSPAIAAANIIQGKPLSYNNVRDADAAHRAASEAWVAQGKLAPAVAIVKHMNPCGLAVANSSQEALELAWAGDPVSAFGSVIAFTNEVGLATAEWLQDKFVEVIVAPYIAPEALKLFATKKNLRLLLCDPRPEQTGERTLVSVSGGMLLQDEDEGLDSELRSVTKIPFPKESHRLGLFGVVAAKYLKSNGIALVRQTESGCLDLVGAGMGQPNRVDCIRLLAGPRYLGKKINSAEIILASDAFFPFADNVEEAFKLGIKKIVQPGGSIRDQEVIDAANRLGVAMAFTGRRHFRH